MVSNWQEVTLGDIFTVKHGFAFKGKYFTDIPKKTILVTPGNFAVGGGFQKPKPKYYDGPYPEEYVLTPGQVVITMTDLSKASDTLGYPAVIPDDGNIWLHNQRIGLVELVDENLADLGFINYLLRTHEYRAWIVGSASGTAVKHTSPGRISEYRCKIPPLSEQRAIAHILGTLDDKIELNRQMNRTLEAMAQALFKSWFIDFDPVVVNALRAGNPIPEKFAQRAAHYRDNPDALRLPEDTLRQFPDRFQDSELGPIPEGWETLTFEDFVKAKQGKYIPKKEMRDHPSGDFVYPVWGGNGIRGYASTWMYEDPVVVLTCRGSNCGLIGLTESSSWISNISFACEPKYGSTYFLHTYFSFSSFKECISGSAQPQITYTALKNKRMEYPVQRMIVDAYSDKVDSLYRKILNNNVESSVLASIRDTLLPKLISGELRVPDAEKLLEDAL